MDELVVYYKPGCPFGIRLRTALTVRGCPIARSGSATTRRALPRSAG